MVKDGEDSEGRGTGVCPSRDAGGVAPTNVRATTLEQWFDHRVVECTVQRMRDTRALDTTGVLHHHKSNLRHFFHCESHALSAEA